MRRDEEGLRNNAEQSAAVLAAAGFPKMSARVLMTLMVSDADGLTARELAETLDASAAAISGAVRYLQTLGIVRRVSRPGTRRDRYELPDDAWYAAFSRETPVYGALAALAESALTMVGDPDSSAAARVDEMARFYRFLGARLPALMGEWETIRTAGK